LTTVNGCVAAVGCAGLEPTPPRCEDAERGPGKLKAHERDVLPSGTDDLVRGLS